MSRRFPKKSFRTPLPPRSKMGGYGRASRKTYFRKSRRQLHPAVSDPPRSQIRARSASPLPKQTPRPHACTSTQRKRCSRKGVCSGPSAWRPAPVEAPVAGVDKVADAANSAAPVRMRLRSWLRVAKVARDRCDRFWTMEKRRRECAGCRPQSARVSERYSLMARRQFADLGLLDRFVWHGASAPSANVWR